MPKKRKSKPSFNDLKSKGSNPDFDKFLRGKDDNDTDRASPPKNQDNTTAFDGFGGFDTNAPTDFTKMGFENVNWGNEAEHDASEPNAEFDFNNFGAGDSKQTPRSEKDKQAFLRKELEAVDPISETSIHKKKSKRGRRERSRDS